MEPQINRLLTCLSNKKRQTKVILRYLDLHITSPTLSPLYQAFNIFLAVKIPNQSSKIMCSLHTDSVVTGEVVRAMYLRCGAHRIDYIWGCTVSIVKYNEMHVLNRNTNEVTTALRSNRIAIWHKNKMHCFLELNVLSFYQGSQLVILVFSLC